MSKTAEEILKKYWGYDSFRPLQKEIIKSVVNGYDTLALMPTGGGKSITYQVSSFLREGICIVITPLISLMKDQVDALKRKGINAQVIHSGLTYREIDRVLDNCVYGDYKFLYVSPERLETPIFLNRFKKMKISLIAIDEAHCISQWGYDFRPSYLKIKKLRDLQPEAPLLAVTATATPEVAKDIMRVLEFRTKSLFSMSFKRENLSYIVRKTEDKYEHLLRVLHSINGSGVVYCRTRGRCEEIATKLQNSAISADFYHAGLSSQIRGVKQDKWLKNQTRIIVATNAFGMGIDKPDVRVVVHYELPSTIEAYYQEAGRAGRDLKESFAVLLYDNNDIQSVEKRLNSEFPPIEMIKEIYHSLHNYLNIAIGDGASTTHDFNIYDFCTKFNHFSITTLAALRILQYNNYLTLTDEIENPTRIKFRVNREELYKIELQHSDLENFIKIILRIYTGLFSDFIAIDEEYIAGISGYTPLHITNILLKLSRLRVLTYIPRKRSPLLLLQEERLPKQNLYISPETYSIRREIAEKRLHSMVKYCTESATCREEQLKSYFGEDEEQPCGKCDICRADKRAGKDLRSPEEKIIEIVSRKEAIEAKELPRLIKGDRKIIEHKIRELIASGKITLNNEGSIQLNTQENH